MTETTFPPEAGQPLKGDGRVIGPIDEGIPCWIDPIIAEKVRCAWLADGEFAIIVERIDGEPIAFALDADQAAEFLRSATSELARRDDVVPQLENLFERTKAEREVR